MPSPSANTTISHPQHVNLKHLQKSILFKCSCGLLLTKAGSWTSLTGTHGEGTCGDGNVL